MSVKMIDLEMTRYKPIHDLVISSYVWPECTPSYQLYAISCKAIDFILSEIIIKD